MHNGDNRARLKKDNLERVRPSSYDDDATPNNQDLADLEQCRMQAEKDLAESKSHLDLARDPSIDWTEKKKVMDSIFQRRASTGRQLHELEKQSQALSTTIIAKQQQLSLCRSEVTEIINLTRSTASNQSMALQQCNFGL